MVMLTLTGTAQQSLDRTTRPGPQPTPAIVLPEIQKATLSNGLAVWVVEKHSLPTVALNMVFQCGADHDPLDKPGIATMTAEMLDAGTTSMDALQISDKLNFLGATMSVRSNFDGTYALLATLTRHLDEALAVYADVITHPTFPQKEFERIQKQRLTSLLQQKDRAATIATLAFNHIIYGKDHPYGNDPAGTDSSVKAMTREDLLKFYSACYRPNGTTLIVVGDVTLNGITEKLEKAFAGWKQGPVPSVAFPPTPTISVRKVYLIDKPGAPQSEIRIGYPSLARSTPDYFAVTVMNRILGGQFSSRLNMNLRERHGYTYGARSGFSFNKKPGPFVASGGFVSTKTDSSLHEFFYEIGRTHAEGLTGEELEFSKKGLTGSFALGFETPAQIAGALQNLVLYGLPEDYYRTYLQNIDKVSLDDVKRVSGTYLDPAKMAVVVVGDVKSIRDGVEKLKLGETVMCDVDGNPLASAPQTN